MATIALTAASFEQTVSTRPIVLVDFWAPWCGPCRQFAPVYEQASHEHPDVVFGTVDTDAEQELATAANIASVPTVMAFREGLCVYSQPGSMSASAVRELIAAVQALDMDEVRAQVAAARAEGTPAPGEASGGGRAGVDYPDENGAIV